jgi:RNA polymerase sigma-70 factor (ECF subfamily)
MHYTGLAEFARPALVNGTAGLVAMPHGRAMAVFSVTVRRGRIAEINILADPDRLARLVPSDA